MDDKLISCWLALGVDVLEQRVVILGFKRNEQFSYDELKKRNNDKYAHCTNIKQFDVVPDDFATKIFEWLRSCNIVESEAKEIMQGMAGPDG